MSELTINLPDPTVDKLKAYLGQDDDPATFVAEAIEAALAKQLAWREHLERLDKGYADARAGRGKDVGQAFADIRGRIKRELQL